MYNQRESRRQLQWQKHSGNTAWNMQALFPPPAAGSLQKAENDVHCPKNRGRCHQGEPANAARSCPALRGAVIRSGRGTQYTSETCRRAAAKYGITQSMNSAGGRCRDNARCGSMRARMKEELLYGRRNTGEMTVGELKTLIRRYFISYWNSRRICSSNEGLPPMVRRQRSYETMDTAA